MQDVSVFWGGGRLSFYPTVDNIEYVGGDKGHRKVILCSRCAKGFDETDAWQ